MLYHVAVHRANYYCLFLLMVHQNQHLMNEIYRIKWLQIMQCTVTWSHGIGFVVARCCGGRKANDWALDRDTGAIYKINPSRRFLLRWGPSDAQVKNQRTKKQQRILWEGLLILILEALVVYIEYHRTAIKSCNLKIARPLNMPLRMRYFSPQSLS